MNSRLVPFVAVTMTLGLAATAPAQFFKKPSEGQQIKLGKQAADELRKKEKVLPGDDFRVRQLRRIGAKIVSTFNDKNTKWDYTFDVIESKEVNAFALPGGPMFFYTGLLDKIHTEDELAAVIGHELTHVRKQHWAYAYRDQQNRQAWLTLGAVVARPSNNTMQAAGLLSELGLDLPFSRKHESEADEGGYEAMVEAGYNPQGMVDVFKMLSQSGGGAPPEWLSDHPSDANRVKKIQQKIDNDPTHFPPQRPLEH